MKRTVVTGLGIISSIGNNVEEVTKSLKTLSSGITLNQVNKEMGLRFKPQSSTFKIIVLLTCT